MLKSVDAIEGEDGQALRGEEDGVLLQGAVGECWLGSGGGEAEWEAERSLVQDLGEGCGGFGGWWNGVEERNLGMRGGGGQGCGGRPWA